MPPSPQVASSDLTSLLIKSGGAVLDGSYQVTTLRVFSGLNRIPYAVLELKDGDAAGGTFTISAGKTLAPGQALDLELGYEGQAQQVFSGVVTRHLIRKRASGPSLLQVEARSHATKLTVGRRSAVHKNTTDSAVLTQLVQAAGLKPQIATTQPQITELTQFQATDWDFLVTSAESNGLVISVDGDQIHAFKPEFSEAAVLSLTYGLDVLDFRLEEDARTQVPSVKTSAWDFKTQALIDFTAKLTELNSIGSPTAKALSQVASPSVIELQSSAALKEDRLTAWADGAMLRSELAKVRGEIRFQGSHLVQPGKTVELHGFGDRFDGKAFVSAVTHLLEEGIWTTTVEIGLDPTSFAEQVPVSAPLAAGLWPGVMGLQNGTVMQIDQDPNGQARVLVRVAMMGKDAPGIWARLAAPYASKKAGVYFYPERDDEVILGFVNGDPGSPIILGSLYSNAKKEPPLTPAADNPVKGLVTKNGIKILFDDGKKDLTLLTPANNKIILSDEQKYIVISDQNQNQLTLSPAGIEISSAKAISLKAQTGITLTTDSGDIELSASAGNISVSGLDVALSAQKQLTASAGVTAALTANGEVTITGALVKIN